MKHTDYSSEYRQEITAEQNQIVAKRNELIQKSIYNLSAQQIKMLLFLISRIKPEDDITKLYSVDIRNFCAVCNMELDSGKNYENVYKTVKKLADSSVWIIINKRKKLCRWLNAVEVDADKATLYYSFHYTIKEMLFNLTEVKTKTLYEYDNVLCMNSKYSIRLYETLNSYKNMEQPIFIPMEILKRCMGAENYTVLKDFRRRAFDKAIEEIKAYSSDIDFDWWFEPGKGKAYKGVSFNIKSLGDYSTEGARVRKTKDKILRGRDVDKEIEASFAAAGIPYGDEE